MGERLKTLYGSTEIADRVKALAAAIRRRHPQEPLLLVGILKSATVFLADLLRALEGDVDLAFIEMKLQDEGRSARITFTSPVELEGRRVIIVEGIVDTGVTLEYLLKHLQERTPASLEVCALLDKRQARRVEVDLHYVGFEVPDVYVVGYGLDDGRGRFRNLPYLAVLEEGAA